LLITVTPTPGKYALPMSDRGSYSVTTVLPTKRVTRGRKRAKRVKWKSSKGIEKIREISEASKQEISEAR
jgi:hypothetical protein